MNNEPNVSMVRLLMALASILCLVAIPVAAQRWWQPMQQRSQQAFVDYNGQQFPQYQWRFVRNENHPSVCVLILTNEATGQFSITAVSGEACD